MKRRPDFLKSCALSLIGAYQRCISPHTPASCRFRPTCSEYARQAIETHGLLAGGWMAVKRVSRCHPFTPMGYDPVPGPEGFLKNTCIVLEAERLMVHMFEREVYFL